MYERQIKNTDFYKYLTLAFKLLTMHIMTKLIQNMLLYPHLYAREIIFKNVKN